MSLRILFLCFLLLAGAGSAQAQEGRPASEYALNISAVYATQWTVYLITQEKTIQEHGSWDHFFEYPLHPEFDKDSFDYNLFKHAWAGQYYYLFYRARGYSESEAFLWTFLSSLAFEFAIETYTEKPSIQDIYQTPIFGTLVGMGFERWSLALRSQDSSVAHFFGYLLNPFALFVKDSSFVMIFPQIDPQQTGLTLSWRY
ncbi:MAG: DUF3943 domain-containing protein [Bdellovibrio sp.]